MFVFTGMGYLVPVVALASFMAVQWAASVISGDWDYYTTHDWVKLVATFFSATTNYLLYRFIERVSPSSTLNKETGEAIRQPLAHSFFFIPVRWWSTVIIVFGLLLLSGMVD